MGSKRTIETQISRKKVKVGGSSKKGRQHAAHVHKYQRQFDRTAINKEKAWDRHIMNHPKDLQAKAHIKMARV